MSKPENLRNAIRSTPHLETSNESPTSSVAHDVDDVNVDRADVRGIAIYQKGILVFILIYFILVIAQFGIPAELRPIVGIGVHGLGVVAAVFVFMLAIKVYSLPVGILMAIITLIPLVGLITLLIINGKATSMLQMRGVSVGLLGARMSDLNGPLSLQPIPRAGEYVGAIDKVDVRAIAKLQKSVLLLIPINLLVFLSQFILPAGFENLIVVCILGLTVMATALAFMLALKVMNAALGVLLGILTLIPLFGLISLLIINGKATSILRSHGISVGLLGARMADFESKE